MKLLKTFFDPEGRKYAILEHYGKKFWCWKSQSIKGWFISPFAVETFDKYWVAKTIRMARAPRFVVKRLELIGAPILSFAEIKKELSLHGLLRQIKDAEKEREQILKSVNVRSIEEIENPTLRGAMHDEIMHKAMEEFRQEINTFYARLDLTQKKTRKPRIAKKRFKMPRRRI